MGGVVLEQDGQLTDAGRAEGSPLDRLNRDTTSTTKDLWSVERTEGNVDLAIDHRMFSEAGRQEIAADWEAAREGVQTLGSNVAELSADALSVLKEVLGIDGELTPEQAEALSARFVFDAQRGQFVLPFSEQEEQVLNSLQTIEQQIKELDNDLYASVDWAQVRKIAFEHCPAFHTCQSGPHYAVNLVISQLADPNLNEYANITYLRDQAYHLRRTLETDGAIIAQAGNVAFGGSAVVGTSRGISDALNSNIGSSRNLGRESGQWSGSGSATDDVAPHVDDIVGNTSRVNSPATSATPSNTQLSAGNSPEGSAANINTHSNAPDLPVGGSNIRQVDVGDANDPTRFSHPPYDPTRPINDFSANGTTIYVRVFTDGVTRPNGSWMMRPEDIQGLTPRQIQDKFDLPYAPTHIVDVTPPAHTTIRTGTVNSANFGGSGGGAQFELIDHIPNDAFTNIRALSE